MIVRWDTAIFVFLGLGVAGSLANAMYHYGRETAVLVERTELANTLVQQVAGERDLEAIATAGQYFSLVPRNASVDRERLVLAEYEKALWRWLLTERNVTPQDAETAIMELERLRRIVSENAK